MVVILHLKYSFLKQLKYYPSVSHHNFKSIFPSLFLSFNIDQFDFQKKGIFFSEKPGDMIYIFCLDEVCFLWNSGGFLPVAIHTPLILSHLWPSQRLIITPRCVLLGQLSSEMMSIYLFSSYISPASSGSTKFFPRARLTEATQRQRRWHNATSHLGQRCMRCSVGPSCCSISTSTPS